VRVSEWVIDTSEATFEVDVIERSKSVPVVIDFWAPWCGPCRTLGPMLERLAEEHGGQFILAKVNVDENPALAQAFQARSIPMVFGVRDGQAAGHFVGALPESAVRDFVQRLLPTEAEQLAQEAKGLRASGSEDEAEAKLRRALELDARCDAAVLGLASLLAERRQDDEALQLLDRIAPATPLRAEADRLSASIRVRQTGGGDEESLQRRVEQDPRDLESRFSLAQLFAAASQYEDALRQYLEIVERDRSFRDDGARKAMLDIFELLGSEDPLVDRYRSALAKVLFA
jgi:putative thioredoxin